MRWFTALLRPETIPSARKKHLPFGMKLRLDIYRRRLLRLRKYYARYAYSDTVTLQGRPGIKIVHEHRDPAFEAELKRMRILPPESLVERDRASISGSGLNASRRFYSEFRFEDSLVVTAGGQKTVINREEESAFYTSIPGRLKTSAAECVVGRYQFTGSLATAAKEAERTSPAREGSLSASLSTPRASGAVPPSPGPAWPAAGQDKPGNGRHTRPVKAGPLFKDDPLLGRPHPVPPPPQPVPAPAHTPAPKMKSVAGVDIDESF